MPRYGERARFHPPRDPAPIRWRLAPWRGASFATATATMRIRDRNAIRSGELQIAGAANVYWSPYSTAGLATAAALGAIVDDTGANAPARIVIGPVDGATIAIDASFAASASPPTEDAPGIVWIPDAGGWTVTLAGGADVDMTNAPVSVAARPPAAYGAIDIWVGAAETAAAALSIDADIGVIAGGEATVETRWRADDLVGWRAVWRGETWLVQNVQYPDRRRTMILNLARQDRE